MVKRVLNLFNSGGNGSWGGKCGVEGSDFVKDEVSEVAEGEDGLHLAFAQEEGDTDALNKEVERLIHVVGERDGDFKV